MDVGDFPLFDPVTIMPFSSNFEPVQEFYHNTAVPLHLLLLNSLFAEGLLKYGAFFTYISYFQGITVESIFS